MLNTYETVFILNPVLSEPQVKDTVEKFKNVLLAQKAEITSEEHWGLKTLAYPVQNKKTGFYILLEFKAEGTTIKPLEIEFTRDENVLRFLTTVMDKFSVEFNEKRKKGAFKKSKQVA
jgi:small subunit ribosomal protein S6